VHHSVQGMTKAIGCTRLTSSVQMRINEIERNYQWKRY